MKNYSKKKRAFTLAEVLITLGIIGVVAALTIPTLISNYQKKVTVAKLKYAYSVLTGAFKMAEVDYGTDPAVWQGSSFNINDFNFLYSTYFKPYLETFNVNQGNICEYYKCASTYKNLAGLDMHQHAWSGSFYLKNGIFIHIHPYHCGFSCRKLGVSALMGGYCDILYIDVNGPEHGPNVLGKDVFEYMLAIGSTIYNSVLVPPCSGYTRDELLKKCSKDFDGAACGAVGGYSCCATLIMQDGWQIKDDYPWF